MDHPLIIILIQFLTRVRTGVNRVPRRPVYVVITLILLFKIFDIIFPLPLAKIEGGYSDTYEDQWYYYHPGLNPVS